MMRIGELVLSQSKRIIEHKQYAVLCAVIFSLLPFVSWLSVALMAFVTLRKGLKPGFEVLLPALIIHSVPLMMLVSTKSAFVNAALTYVPCFIAALSLRKTQSWQIVAGVFFLQALFVFVLIELLIPDFVAEQLTQFKSMLSVYQEYQQFFENKTQGLSDFYLAQLILGIQTVSVVASALISLVFARLIQAKLFVPGGLKLELVNFRGSKLAALILVAVSVGSYYGYAFAIKVLPLILSYFLLAGFNLAYFIGRKWHLKIILLLFLLVAIEPTFTLFAYMVFGLLDSLFNFRLYLPRCARESI